MCRFSCNQIADLEHSLLTCDRVKEVGNWIINLVLKSDPSAGTKDIVCLNFSGTDSLFWLVVNALSFTWAKRSENKQARTDDLIATTSQTLEFLTHTVHKKIAEEALQIISEN